MTAVETASQAPVAPQGLAAARPWRAHLPGQRSELRIHDLRTGEDTEVLRSSELLFEAPNWSPDGLWLVVNADGLLYRVSAKDGGALEQIITDGLSDSNNDHVLSADGRFLYSTSQGGHLWQIPLDGGRARQVTRDDDGLLKRYLHGVSPDGSRLAFIGSVPQDGAAYNVYTAAVSDGAVRSVTVGDSPHDGAEFSPDGGWIYLNSERASSVPGHAQLFRIRENGSDLQQLTSDDRVNWFPHLSPDGSQMLYLSYEPATLGHPANRKVELRLADPDGSGIRTILSLFGGQGTINVNSWSPDGQRFAYVSYPLES